MYKVEIENKGDYFFKAKSGDYEIDIDPKGKAMSPLDVFLASLGSCVGVYIRKYFDGAKIPLGNFSVKLEAEFSRESPVCFRDINVAIDLKGFVLEEKRKKPLLDFVKNCPIHSTLKNTPEIKVDIK